MKEVSHRRAGRFDPSRLDVVVMDRSHFDRNVMSVILRCIGVRSIHVARSAADVLTLGLAHDIGCVIIGGRAGEPVEEFVSTSRVIRHMSDSSLRAVPLIGVMDAAGSSSFAVSGMDAGMDMLLVRPLSPEVLSSRLAMVIESPRPLVEGGEYSGPCRRRREIDSVFGLGRRKGDQPGPNRLLRDDAIGRALSALGGASAQLAPGEVSTLPAFQTALTGAYRAASEAVDTALMDCLDIYGAYVLRTLSRGIIDSEVVRTSVSALMQIAVMPHHSASARRTVADELVRVVSHRAGTVLR